MNSTGLELNGKKNFYISVLFILVFPLLPLVYEKITANHLFDTSIALTACLYSITVLTTSDNLVHVFISLIPATSLGLIYARLIAMETLNAKGMVYIIQKNELLLSTDSPIRILKHDWGLLALCVSTIITIALIHGSERYRRHYLGDECFLAKYK